MKNINVSKLTSLIESKKQSSIGATTNNNANISHNSNISNQTVSSFNTHNTNNNKSLSQSIPNTSLNQSRPTKPPSFKVQSTPPEKFLLFEKKDFYHYERKFHNELPKVIIPGPSFHYISSNENFASYDNMTMMLGLKRHHEIMTDSRLNTKISKDFMDNSLSLLFPERDQPYANSQKLSQLKEEVMSIIEEKEESELDKIKIENDRRVNPSSFYLRRSTLMGSALNQKKKNNTPFKNAYQSKVSNSNITGTSLVNLKKCIADTFESSSRIVEGSEHPSKKGVTAGQVYEILPFQEYAGVRFNQIIFPNDPLTEINPDEADKNYLLPDKFLLKKNELHENEFYSFYKNENVRLNNENSENNENNENNEDEDYYNKVKYFTYERDFLINFSTNENEIFNRHFIFLNKSDKTAKFLPIDTKLLLKKHKRIVNVPNEYDEYENITNTNLSRKRERDIIVFPKNLHKDVIRDRNNRLRERGVLKELVDVPIDYNKNELAEVRERLIRRDMNKDKKQRKYTKDVEEEVELKDETDKEEMDLFDSDGGVSQGDEEREGNNFADEFEQDKDDNIFNNRSEDN